MSYFKQKYEILDNAKVVDEATWKRQVGVFIDTFVVQSRRARWRHLCIEKPQKARADSHKIYSNLDWKLCSQITEDTRQGLIGRTTKGVYYGFSAEAWWLTPLEALAVGHGSDGIYCIEDGALGIFFWHELEDYLCRNEALSTS